MGRLIRIFHPNGLILLYVPFLLLWKLRFSCLSSSFCASCTLLARCPPFLRVAQRGPSLRSVSQVTCCVVSVPQPDYLSVQMETHALPVESAVLCNDFKCLLRSDSAEEANQKIESNKLLGSDNPTVYQVHPLLQDVRQFQR